jgi:uncharacterized NAD(P)/FAD-binding protein YdhS
MENNVMPVVRSYTVAIVGTGPRGILLLERLITRLKQDKLFWIF